MPKRIRMLSVVAAGTIGFFLLLSIKDVRIAQPMQESGGKHFPEEMVARELKNSIKKFVEQGNDKEFREKIATPAIKDAIKKVAEEAGDKGFGGVIATPAMKEAIKEFVEATATRAINEGLKEAVLHMARKAYVFDLIKSINLFVSVSLNEQVLNLVKSGFRSPNREVSTLNELMKTGSAKWLLAESDRYRALLKRSGYKSVELCLIQTDIRCRDLSDKKGPDLSRGLISDSDIIVDIQAAGHVEGDIKKVVSQLKEKREPKGVLCFLLFLPSSNKEPHLFTSTITITFYCTKDEKSYLKRVQFDLFLDDLQPKESGAAHYLWQVENQKYDDVD